MKTLVLCIDRDDDLGRKANIYSPIIGRENNIEALTRLGLEDPEESDVNAILAAVSIYDQLKKSEEDVEVATICGDVSIGIKSDDVISTQLEMVLDKIKPDDVVVVTDGAEDEFLLPLITSRIKVKSFRRVTVKQSKNIESMYYFIMKAMKDEKILKSVVVPIGIILIGLGLFPIIISMLTSIANWNIDSSSLSSSLVLLALGIYFLEKAYRIGSRTHEYYINLKKEVSEAKITIISSLIFATLLLIGIKYGYDNAHGGIDWVEGTLFFLGTFIPWFIVAMIVREIGKIVDSYMNKKPLTRSFWISVIFTIGTSIVILALIYLFQMAFGYVSSSSFIPFLILMIWGIVIGILAAVIQKITKGDLNNKEQTLSEAEEHAT